MQKKLAGSLWVSLGLALIFTVGFGQQASAQNSGTVTSSGPLLKIFFTDGGADIAGGGVGLVRSVNPDGTGLTTLVPAAGVRPRGIVLDDVNGHLYWNDFGNFGTTGKTLRSDLDGSNVVTVVDHGQGGVNDIDLDIAAGHVYMALSVSFSPFHGVRRVNFDGTGLVDLIRVNPGKYLSGRTRHGQTIDDSDADGRRSGPRERLAAGRPRSAARGCECAVSRAPRPAQWD